jgi:hypothetical protein
MWVPGGLYHLAAALWFLAAGLKDSALEGLDQHPADREQAAERDERDEPGLPAPALR